MQSGIMDMYEPHKTWIFGLLFIQIMLKKLVATLKDFGFDDSNLTPRLFLEKPKIIRMGLPPMRLEISTSISGVEFEECYRARIIDEFDGVEVNVIDLEHLKRNKKASGRTKDKADLEQLP